MSFFEWFFQRPISIKLNERKIKIIFEELVDVDTETKDKLKKIIQDFCEKDPIAKQFKKLSFTIHSFYSYKREFKQLCPTDCAGYVKPNELENGISNIHLPWISDKKIQNDLVDKLDGILRHELTHIWHYKISKMFKLAMDSESRLTKAISKIEKDNPHFSKSKIGKLRVIIAKYVVRFYSEGIARYYENINSLNADISNDTFKKLHKEAEGYSFALNHYLIKCLESINKPEDEILIRRKFVEFDDFKNNIYLIGYHMVYTILYFSEDNLDLSKIADMSYIGFLKEYEHVMLKNGLKPVVSWNSKKGTLDYNNIIQKLNEESKKIHWH